VWFGRLVPEKAPHDALRIAAASGRRVRLAGPLPNRRYFDDAVRPLLGPGAEYVGHLGVDDLVTLVGCSAASLVTPAWDEPYGLVAAESLACGTPVLGFDRGGLREFVTPGCGVLVAGGDLEAAARQVEEVASLDRGACREQAVRRCSVEHMIDAYLSVYADVSSLGRAA
jgi:glycosyltransferase involved in cell wall biosynthesis